jgi:hypothetical protein
LGRPRVRRVVTLAVGCAFAALPFLTTIPADAATSALPTAGGSAACGRLATDRAKLRSAAAVQHRDARIRTRTAHQRALKAARLRKDAARTGAATARLRADTAACNARWHWQYPNAPRLDQGMRPTCGFFAAMQQLNARGARVTQAMADQISDEVSPKAPSAALSTDDLLRSALTHRGIRVSYQRIPPTADATLAAVQRGPVTVGLRFTTAMYTTDRAGHWLANGAPTGLDHAVVLIGYDPTTQHVLLLNQWGRWWGTDGAMWLSRTEYARLLISATVWTRA